LTPKEIFSSAYALMVSRHASGKVPAGILAPHLRGMAVDRLVSESGGRDLRE
jgi:hypothetical protein